MNKNDEQFLRGEQRYIRDAIATLQEVKYRHAMQQESCIDWNDTLYDMIEKLQKRNIEIDEKFID